jgi:hypothetical protein
MSALFLVKQYLKHNPNPLKINLRTAQANRFWIKHKLNATTMSKLLHDTSLAFSTRCDLVKALAVAERKVKYWERHENFDLKSATIVFRATKNAKIVVDNR